MKPCSPASTFSHRVWSSSLAALHKGASLQTMLYGLGGLTDQASSLGTL